MSNTTCTAFKSMLLKGQVVVLSDTFKLILMQEGFVYVPTTHITYSTVSAVELPTAYGYTVGGVALTGAAITTSLTLGWAKLAWTDAQWSISGGTVNTAGAFIYDDTVATGDGDDYSDVLVAYIDPGGTVTAVSGSLISVNDIYVTLT